MAGYEGRHHTQELVSRTFTEDKWLEDVARYVTQCVKCQKSKADRQSRQTQLVPMLTGEGPFMEIAMNFVGELPKSEGFPAIIVVTEQFARVQHDILVKTT